MNNRKIAAGFGALLLATGLLGLTHMTSPVSSATPYDLFHLVFGALGLACSIDTRASKSFNAGFGALDLYQALAQQLNWFPVDYFIWKPADQILHIVIGGALVAAGFVLD